MSREKNSGRPKLRLVEPLKPQSTLAERGICDGRFVTHDEVRKMIANATENSAAKNPLEVPKIHVPKGIFVLLRLSTNEHEPFSEYQKLCRSVGFNLSPYLNWAKARWESDRSKKELFDPKTATEKLTRAAFTILCHKHSYTREIFQGLGMEIAPFIVGLGGEFNEFASALANKVEQSTPALRNRV